MSTLRGFGRALDRITIYLPIILMAVLAPGALDEPAGAADPDDADSPDASDGPDASDTSGTDDSATGAPVPATDAAAAVPTEPAG